MSGTSLDGIDGVLLSLSSDGSPPRVVASHHLDMPAALRSSFLALNQPGDNELHRSALAANALAQCQATVVQTLLTIAQLTPDQVQVIGSHGQTVRHQPPQVAGMRPELYLPKCVFWTPYTLQLNNPALLAELTGIPVVADFRSRDVAAGGQGAPLVPAFHAALFGRDGPSAVVNIGGMANVTLLTPGQPPHGFDTGPGNVLMDAWCQRHLNAVYDANGEWARSGSVIPNLLERLLADPYFAKQGPRSTGRDLFNLDWLDGQLRTMPSASAADVQATLLQLTARSIADAIPPELTEVTVCGGGALNGALMQQLQRLCPSAKVTPSSSHGIPVMDVEAAAFAWLADQTLRGKPANVVEVTGASGPRVLGAVYPA